MLDLFQKQEEIKSFIQVNFNNFLTTNNITLPSEYIEDIVDLDSYQKNDTVFFNFDSIQFEILSNDSNTQKIILNVCFCCRNNKISELKRRCLNLASAFYNFFNDETFCNHDFNGLIDFGSINEITFYDAVSGTKTIKIANLTLELNVET